MRKTLSMNLGTQKGLSKWASLRISSLSNFSSRGLLKTQTQLGSRETESPFSESLLSSKTTTAFPHSRKPSWNSWPRSEVSKSPSIPAAWSSLPVQPPPTRRSCSASPSPAKPSFFLLHTTQGAHAQSHFESYFLFFNSFESILQTQTYA